MGAHTGVNDYDSCYSRVCVGLFPYMGCQHRNAVNWSTKEVNQRDHASSSQLTTDSLIHLSSPIPKPVLGGLLCRKTVDARSVTESLSTQNHTDKKTHLGKASLYPALPSPFFHTRPGHRQTASLVPIPFRRASRTRFRVKRSSGLRPGGVGPFG